MGQILCRIFRCIFGISRRIQNVSDDDDLEQGLSHSQSNLPFPPVSSSRTSSSCLQLQQDVEEIVKEEITSEIISTTTRLIDDDHHQPIAHHVSGQLQQFITVKDLEKIGGEEEEVEIRWIEHYNNGQKILLVGEGDFSFSSSLADAFVSASNIIATSLDSLEFLRKNYRKAISNIKNLEKRGSIVMHEINVAEMANHPLLKDLKFDRIIYNFPLAGFFHHESRQYQLLRNQTLVATFMENARKLLHKNGEIHITHKCIGFFLDWNLKRLGSNSGLQLLEAIPFKYYDYPGYSTKYGFGGDNFFNCNPSMTYKFGII